MNWFESLCAVLLILNTLPCSARSSKSGDPESRQSRGSDFIENRVIADGRAQSFADPGTCKRWRYERNGDHPSWPPRLVMVSDEVSCSSQSNVNPGMKGQKTEWLRHHTIIVLAGDELAVSDETAALLANLEGVALNNGSPGEVIGVRLRLGGRIMRAQVLAPGRVRLIADARQAR